MPRKTNKDQLLRLIAEVSETEWHDDSKKEVGLILKEMNKSASKSTLSSHQLSMYKVSIGIFLDMNSLRKETGF